jgi:hypothetical protein
VRGREGVLRHQVQGFAVLALGLALTSAGLATLAWLAPAASRLLELSVIVAATVTATAVKFVLFRTWVFRPATSPLERQP